MSIPTLSTTKIHMLKPNHQWAGIRRWRLWRRIGNKDGALIIGISAFIKGPGGSDSKESACNAGDQGLIPGLGGSPGNGNSNPLQYSCLENPVDRGACQTIVHGLTKRLQRPPLPFLPCEDSRERQPSVNREMGPWQTPNQLGPDLGFFQLLELWEINFGHL